jgi:hypothetical protein
MKKLALLACVLALAAAAAIPDLAQLERMTARYAPAQLRADTSQLAPGDRQALAKLIGASRVIDDIFMVQLWAGNAALYSRLQQDATPLAKARVRYYWINKGPWSDLDEHAAFIPGVPERKPLGANFYPDDMTKQEFEAWVRGLAPAEREKAEGFFTVIRRGAGRQLFCMAYSQAYFSDLRRAADLLREAAGLTANASLKKFLTFRADAFLSNDYYASDVAWMELDSPVDITIGPYETYSDELFGYKAAFEAYVNLRDEQETAKLKFFANHLQEVENNLPIDAKYRNPKLGALAPIIVVNEVFAAGDGAHGVQTAAYSLPNDERVVREKGSKRVMLKNVQEAKFNSVLLPIAARLLPKASLPQVTFDAFFTHILAHELSHGLGPQQIEVQGKATTVRQQLKELHGAIEEAKADVTGLFLLQLLKDKGLLPAGFSTENMYTTYLASSFRTLRFGAQEAHGRGMAVQFNYLADKGAFVANPDGTFQVDQTKIADAVAGLTHDLLMLEAAGDYDAARKMLETLGVIRPPMQKALARLGSIPVDIEPVFVTAESLSKPAPAPKE